MNHKRIDDLDVPDEFVLPEGNLLRGQALFKKHCSQCHTIRRDGMNPYGTMWGPNLYGVVGRTAAQNQRTSWSGYSRSMEESGILWTERNLMAFLKNPRAFAGGVIAMNFRGIDSFRDRVDIVHYLRRAGHESWMLQDGTPHSQKRWWTRGGSNSTQSYWQVNVDEKQVKPREWLWRAIGDKVGEVRDLALDAAGWEQERPRADTALGPSGSNGAFDADPEKGTWNLVRRVADGVRPASTQSAFNWPPPEVITEGPVRRRRGQAGTGKAGKDSSPSPSSLVASCDDRGDSTSVLLGPGLLSPSGLIVYKDRGGPAAGPAAPPSRVAVALAPPSAEKLRPDGGRLTKSGLVAYAA
mmetsp:Transcript_77889/g.158224  ORF Transcript_77889/g.158224 Transcript_77889/m.158224 type:complete len:354 (-) Transcript_77889:50-1111(-)